MLYLKRYHQMNLLIGNFSNSETLSLVCTGHGFDLKNENYEFPIALIIHNPLFFTHFHTDISYNWEVSQTTKKAKIPYFSSTDDNNINQLLGYSWSNEALFSFIKGIKWLKNYSLEKISLPDFSVDL